MTSSKSASSCEGSDQRLAREQLTADDVAKARGSGSLTRIIEDPAGIARKHVTDVGGQQQRPLPLSLSACCDYISLLPITAGACLSLLATLRSYHPGPYEQQI